MILGQSFRAIATYFASDRKKYHYDEPGIEQAAYEVFGWWRRVVVFVIVVPAALVGLATCIGVGNDSAGPETVNTAPPPAAQNPWAKESQ